MGSQMRTMTEVVYGHSYDRPRGNTLERMMYQIRKKFGLKPTAPIHTKQTTTGGCKSSPHEPKPAKVRNFPAPANRRVSAKARLLMGGCLQARQKIVSKKAHATEL